jgi:two-component system nitrate/nitrite sensor histidine kinase NarX
MRSHSKSLLISVMTAFLLGSLILLGAGTLFLLNREPGDNASYLWMLFILSILAIVMTSVLYFLFNRHFVRTIDSVRDWVKNIQLGQLDTRITLADDEELLELSSNINKIGAKLNSLYMNMDEEIERQTDRIAQKNKSLQVLYDVAASINASRDLSDLLTRFLHTMRELVNAKGGTVRLLNDNDEMELVASIGLEDEVVELERTVPVQRCLCGNAVIEGDVLFQEDMRPCNKLIGRPIIANSDLEMIAVPLQYRGKNLGVYNLFVERTDTQSREEIKALFTSIGRHLGMAIDKSRLDDEAKRLSIMQERNTLAHELHDSLAQTLASLRFQVSMLDETFDKQNDDANHLEIQQIKGGLDEAYTELRELLAHFRAPVNALGLLPALEDLISSYRQQTGMHVLLQKEWDSTQLTASMEMQVLRIVQEALANIRKHSKAHTVRVLLRCDKEHNYNVLVEDDGVGLARPAFTGHPGEHIGLSIMQERARYLGGELRIESEQGEGTRIQLTFRYPKLAEESERQRFALI